MVIGKMSEILVEEGRPGIKEVCHVSEFRSFQCNHNTYGLCLGLVLSAKPHLGTNIWRLKEHVGPPCVVLVINDNLHGLMCVFSYTCGICPLASLGACVGFKVDEMERRF